MVWDGGDDARYLDAIRRPFRMWTRLDVEDRDGNLLYRGLPMVDGTLTGNLQNRVTRTLAFALPGMTWFPVDPAGQVDPTAILAPFGNRIRAFAGVEYGDGSRTQFPIFYGRIDEVTAPGGVSTAVSCVDLAGDVADAAFETPTNSVATNSVYLEWQRLILNALDDAFFEPFPGGVTGAPIGNLSWESDRGQALDNMAAGVGCLWWARANGQFVLRTSPWSDPAQTVAFTISEAGVGGSRVCSINPTPKVSRQGVVNSVVFSSERLDGSAPLTAVQRDMDPSSPTYYFGKFGRKPLLIQNQSPGTQDQVEYAAKVQLHYGRSLVFAWDQVSIPPDPSIELGDLINMRFAGLRSPQVITGFTLPLRESAMMTLTLRAYVPLVGV